MIWFNVILLLILGAASILLASVEAAFYLIKRRRLSHVAVQNPRAELVNQYLEDPPSLLMPIHMGAYTAHVGMTVIITSGRACPGVPKDTLFIPKPWKALDILMEAEKTLEGGWH